MSQAPNFWEFSLRHYANQTISQSCLRLQDELGADVNMILFCVWFARYRGLMDPTLLNAAVERSQHWQQHLVIPLRGCRRWLKQAELKVNELPTDSEKLRMTIKQIELEAEKIQQNRLDIMATAIPTQPLSITDQSQACVKNLKAYFQQALLGLKGNAYVNSRADLATITCEILALNANDKITESDFDG